MFCTLTSYYAVSRLLHTTQVAKEEYLESFIQHRDGFIELLLQRPSASASSKDGSLSTDNVGDDARQQLALLVLVWALLEAGKQASVDTQRVSLTMVSRRPDSAHQCLIRLFRK